MINHSSQIQKNQNSGKEEKMATVLQNNDGSVSVVISLDEYNRLRNREKENREKESVTETFCQYNQENDMEYACCPESNDNEGRDSQDGAVVTPGSGMRAALSRGLRAMVF